MFSSKFVVFSVKQVAMSTYNDVKNRSYILMKHNVEKIKRLDVDIDLAPSYFLLPQNGVYQEYVHLIIEFIFTCSSSSGVGQQFVWTSVVSL